MADSKTQRWRELCAQAAVEQDPQKLLKLVTEINRLLDHGKTERERERKRDFTALPIGLKIENGEIQVCPYCNRRGKLEVVAGKSYYLHLEILSADAHTPAVKCDMCPQIEKHSSMSG